MLLFHFLLACVPSYDLESLDIYDRARCWDTASETPSLVVPNYIEFDAAIATDTGSIGIGADESALGGNLGPAGDFDGDEIADLVVSAESTIFGLKGKILGSLTTSDATWAIDVPDLSVWISNADLDGDGNPELIVAGGTTADATLEVRSFDGGVPDGDATTSYTLPITFTPTGLAAGDIDGDGLAELLLGSSSDDRDRLAVLQSEFGEVDELASLDEASSGRTVTMGDLDGDGLMEFVMGEPGSERDTVVVWDGMEVKETGMLVVSDAEARLYSAQTGGVAGVSVAVIGDMDGDGIAELAVGAPNADERGAAYIIRGPIHGTIGLEGADTTLWGETTGSMAGSAVAGAGDVNGDQFADLLVSDPTRKFVVDADDDLSPQAVSLSVTYLVLGPVEGDTSLCRSNGVNNVSSLAVWDGTAGSGHPYGSSEDYRYESNYSVNLSISGLGDLNADGYADYGVGSPEFTMVLLSFGGEDF